MPLNFQPAPDWLLQDYMNRKSPGQQVLDSGNQAAATYMAYKNQKATQALAQEQKDIELAKLHAEGGSNSVDWLNDLRKSRGLPPLGPLNMPGTTPAQPQLQPPPSDVPTNGMSSDPAGPLNAPQQGPALPGVGLGLKGELPPQSGMGMRSPIIDHWHNTMGNQQTQTPSAMNAGSPAPVPPTMKPQAPQMGSDPAIQEFLQLGAKGYQDKYGLQGMKKVKEALEIEKGLQDRQPAGSGTPKTLEAFLMDKVTKGEMPLQDAVNQIAQSKSTTEAGVDTAKNTVKLRAEKPKAAASLTNTEREYDNMIKEAEDIMNDPSVGSATGMASALSIVPGTGAKRVAARLETLKAKTLLNVLASLKELSATGASGFGALSNTEGENLRNSISTLDRNLSTGDFKSSMSRFIGEMKQRKGVLRSTFNQTYGEGESPSTTPVSTGGDIPTISDDKAFKALPSGSRFKDPSGQTHTKR